MKILSGNEREELKQSRLQDDIDMAHYHRFLSSDYPEGIEIDDSVIWPTFEEYKGWKKKFPGWTVGRLTRTHVAWRPEYAKMLLPMNQKNPFKKKERSGSKALVSDQ